MAVMCRLYARSIGQDVYGRVSIVCICLRLHKHTAPDMSVFDQGIIVYGTTIWWATHTHTHHHRRPQSCAALRMRWCRPQRCRTFTCPQCTIFLILIAGTIKISLSRITCLNDHRCFCVLFRFNERLTLYISYITVLLFCVCVACAHANSCKIRYQIRAELSRFRPRQLCAPPPLKYNLCAFYGNHTREPT